MILTRNELRKARGGSLEKASRNRHYWWQYWGDPWDAHFSQQDETLVFPIWSSYDLASLYIVFCQVLLVMIINRIHRCDAAL